MNNQTEPTESNWQALKTALKAIFLPRLMVQDLKATITKRNRQIYGLRAIIRDAKKRTDAIFNDTQPTQEAFEAFRKARVKQAYSNDELNLFI